ncbi:MAG: hypothetical protein ACRDYZ_09590 [Acidimicrobiales bacterium]
MPGDREAVRRRGGRDHRSGRGGWDALAVCGVIAIAAGVVGGLAWTRPTSTTSTVHYTQSGRLTYHAPVSPTSIYGTTQVRTGQPVYTNVVNALTVGYSYRLTSPAPATLSGTERLAVTIGNGQGITRTIPLQSPTRFRGNKFDATATLDLTALQAIALQFAGSARGGQGTYDVTVSPSVEVTGRLGGVPLHATFDEPATFSLAAGILAPKASSPGGTPGAGSGAPGTGGAAGAGAAGSGSGSKQSANQLVTTAPGSVRARHGQPATLFLGLTVANLRVAALIVLAIALFAGAFVGWPVVRDATSEDERRRIVARHGPSLVEVAGLPTGPGVIVVELASFEGLLQVAQRTECPLLHAYLHGAGDVYGVVDTGTVYRYGAYPPVASALVRTNGSKAPTLAAPGPATP